MGDSIKNGGCGKGCLNVFFWIIVIGLLIEAWQASSGLGRGLELLGLVALLVGGGWFVRWSKRHPAEDKR